MSCEDDAVQILRRAGHKVTPQRRMILKVLRHAPGHISAAQITERVREEYPFVDISTVYRTLDMLKRLNLATVTDMGGGDSVFEWVTGEPHHHLICSRCGHIAELSHDFFEGLTARLEEEQGFTPDLQHFAIFGLCRDCRGAS